MKPKHKTIHSEAVIRCAILMSGLSFAMTMPAFSQAPGALPGLGGFGTTAGAPVVPPENPETSRASRYMDSEKLTTYLQEVGGNLNILSRKSDPFGQVQDPTAKAAAPKPTITNRRPTRYKPTAFSDIVGKIRINTIRPADGVFLIGTRSFKMGDKFPIGFRGKNTEVEVVGVSAQKIDFKNVETGEVASVKLSLMPAGMKSGSDGFSAPGMVSDKADAPLQLDPVNR